MTKPPLELSYLPGADPHRVDISVGPAGQAGAEVYFVSPNAALRRSGDALLCLGLVPAMELGRDLLVTGVPVDRRLLANADRIQDLLCGWYPGYRRIDILAEPGDSTFQPNRGTGLFFSGGVDSSYSLTIERSRIRGLVTIVGADVDVADPVGTERLGSHAKRVAAHYGVDSIMIESNMRKIFDRMVGWVEFHGAALAAIRHLLGDRFDCQLIASSADEASWNRRWGSHPALDPLFGFDGARIEHQGLVHRLAKLERVLDEPVLMSGLTVCHRGNGNCGVCLECTFDMRGLGLLDAFGRAPTFPPEHTGTGHIVCTGEGSVSDLRNLRAAASEANRQTLVAEIDSALAWYATKKKIYRILPLPEMKRRFKRLKRKSRFARWERRRDPPA